MRPILVAQLTFQNGQRLVVDVALADMPQRLDDGPALAAGRRHVARRGALEHDLLLTELDPARGAVRQKDDARGHLLGQAQDIRGVGARWLQADCVALGQGFGNGIGGRRDPAEAGVINGVVVQPAGELADDAFPGAAGPVPYRRSGAS